MKRFGSALFHQSRSFAFWITTNWVTNDRFLETMINLIIKLLKYIWQPQTKIEQYFKPFHDGKGQNEDLQR